MKKILIVIGLIISITTFISCSDGCRTINIDGVGSFKVPDDWIFTEEDGLVYFTDKPIDESDCVIYLIEQFFPFIIQYRISYLGLPNVLIQFLLLHSQTRPDMKKMIMSKMEITSESTYSGFVVTNETLH